MFLQKNQTLASSPLESTFVPFTGVDELICDSSGLLDIVVNYLLDHTLPMGWGNRERGYFVMQWFRNRASLIYVKCPKKDSVIKVSLAFDLLFSDD